jgi:predicted branched-subunit amino acid permease
MTADATTRSIVRDGIAVGIATGAYGVSFGAVSVASGLDVWQSCALSLLVFTGASQFALVGVIGSGGSPVLGAVSGLLLGTRNTLYGLKVAPLVGWHGHRKAMAAHLVIDESSAMTVTRTRQDHAVPGSWPPGSRCSCSGTSPPWPVPSPATRSATRAPTVSTPPSGPPSSGCCGHG